MIIKDFRQSKKINLTSLSGAELEIFSGVLFKDAKVVDDVMRAGDKGGDPEKMLKMIAICIKSWNFTDESGKELPINEASLNLLSPDVIIEISKLITDFANEKKNS